MNSLHSLISDPLVWHYINILTAQGEMQNSSHKLLHFNWDIRQSNVWYPNVQMFMLNVSCMDFIFTLALIQWFKIIKTTLKKYISQHWFHSKKILGKGYNNEVQKVRVKLSSIKEYYCVKSFLAPYNWNSFQIVNCESIVAPGKLSVEQRHWEEH